MQASETGIQAFMDNTLVQDAILTLVRFESNKMKCNIKYSDSDVTIQVIEIC